MARNKLSDTKVRALTKPGIYSDGEGLFIRVHKGGSRNWVFIYRRAKGRHEIGLGGFGQGTAPVSVALAREKAESIRQRLARGEDPKPSETPRVITFAFCMEAVLAAKAKELRSAKHFAGWDLTLREYAEPLHAMPVADISLGDVKECLAVHWEQRPETADRLRARIQAVIDYAIAHEWRLAGNPARWHGLLDKVMPARQRLTRGHHAALAYGDVPATIAGLRLSTGVAARATEFAALTAARSGEVRGATWSEFDLDRAVWTVPGTRMKAGREHRVPLAPRALEILAAMKQRSTGDLVFGGGSEGRPISDTAMTKSLRLASKAKPTLHGFRSSFRDWAGDRTSHSREIAEAALAHTIGDAAEQAYRRGDALEKRRLLMCDWADFCSDGMPDQRSETLAVLASEVANGTA